MVSSRCKSIPLSNLVHPSISTNIPYTTTFLHQRNTKISKSCEYFNMDTMTVTCNNNNNVEHYENNYCFGEIDTLDGHKAKEIIKTT